MHLHRQPFAYTHSLTQVNVKNVVRSAFAYGGMINTPLMDSGQYLAHAAADRTKCIILENKPDNNSAFQEWNRSDLAGIWQWEHFRDGCDPSGRQEFLPDPKGD